MRILELNMKRALEEVGRVVVVDNMSIGVSELADLCARLSCDFVEVSFNSGVPYALKLGINYAQRYSPSWILFLDQDSILLRGSIHKALSFYSSLSDSLKGRIGIIALGQRGSHKNCSAMEVFYYTFSGTLIKNSIAKIAPLRVNFFLDCADFDLYHFVMSKGFKTLLLNCKLMLHRIGIPYRVFWIIKLKEFLFKAIKLLNLRTLGKFLLPREPEQMVSYEKPIRYYYIVRNSLILLKEGKMDPLGFFASIIWVGLSVAWIDGIRKALKAFGLGAVHGLLQREGRLDAHL
jgi:rhamnosyltransferase